MFADEVDFLRARALLIARAHQLQNPNSTQLQEIEELLRNQQSVRTDQTQSSASHCQEFPEQVQRPSWIPYVLKPLFLYGLLWLVLFVGGTIIVTIGDLDSFFLANVLAGMLVFVPAYVVALLIRYVALRQKYNKSK
ncbi:PF06781 family protein [Atopobium sp. BV3Ac4]|nr:PF06781 family protein [Atopobium sp. BV3Ac4]